MTQVKSNNGSSVRLTFYGAARTVTGSKYLVENDQHKILVDCGLFQGKKKLRDLNWAKPLFDPASLSAIVLTHAHIDHSGYLPLIVKSGYRGPIYCTAATAELLNILLPDSAHLQEEDARWVNVHGTSKHRPALPLYNQADVAATLRLLRVIERDKQNELFAGVNVTPRCAGHILGACSLSLDVGGKRITFSGDIGRYNEPILPDPCPVDIGDLLLCESTYGDRLHHKGNVREELTTVILRSIQRGGPLIVPAFAVGRTQVLLYLLAELERAGKIPVLPIFVDSPMATDSTDIYLRYSFDYDKEATQLLEEGKLPFQTGKLKFTTAVEESKYLNNLRGPRIIISASGMATGGRVLHHLRNHLPNPEATILFVGYQAQNTRGFAIQSGASTVKIFGANVEIKASIETISSLSAHGDWQELIQWLKSCSGSPRIAKIVHGEENAVTAFAARIKSELGWNAEPANYLETIEV